MNLARIAVLAILFFLSLHPSNAQCPAGDIILTTQADIDNFTTNFPACTELQGKLVVGIVWTPNGTNINSLAGLSGITKTKGLVVYGNALLDDLNGLHNLTDISGDIMIQSNPELDHLLDLSNVTSEAKSITISSNSELYDLEGLENISLSQGPLMIEYNDVLSSLDGLQGVVATTEFRVTDNPELKDISALLNLKEIQYGKLGNLPELINLNGLEGLTKVDFNLELYYMPKLQNVKGLVNLANVGNGLSLAGLASIQNVTGLDGLVEAGSINILNNASLESLSALANLKMVDDIQITGNDKLETLDGLESLTQINNLYMFNNPSLLSLEGLDNLTIIRNNFQLSGNPELTDFDHLGSLTKIEGILAIINNDKLADISGFQSAALDGASIMISENDLLAVCAVTNVCNFVDLSAGAAYVSNNEAGCNTTSEVQNACALLALPVDLTSFTVALDEGHVVVQWEIENEKSIARYFIDRSADGTNWTRIATVTCRQENNAQRYLYEDESPARGQNYYRLTYEELDGTLSNSEIRTLIFGYVGSDLTVFPNPAQDMVTIDYLTAGKLVDEVEILLYDLTGKIVRKWNNNLSGLTHLDIQGLPSGHYTLKVNDTISKLVITYGR